MKKITAPRWLHIAQCKLQRITPHPSPLTHNEGVTIIELLISIGVIGVLAAIGIPQLTGIYSNQLIINTANELVSDIKVAQNRALANDQDSYTQNPPSNDCSTTESYIDKWGLKVSSSSQYQIYAVMREESAATGDDCEVRGSQTKITKNIADSVQISSVNVGQHIEYATTSGEASDNGLFGSNGIVITGSRTPLTYYVCVDIARRAYAQTSECP